MVNIGICARYTAFRTRMINFFLFVRLERLEFRPRDCFVCANSGLCVSDCHTSLPLSETARDGKEAHEDMIGSYCLDLGLDMYLYLNISYECRLVEVPEAGKDSVSTSVVS